MISTARLTTVFSLTVPVLLLVAAPSALARDTQAVAEEVFYASGPIAAIYGGAGPGRAPAAAEWSPASGAWSSSAPVVGSGGETRQYFPGVRGSSMVRFDARRNDDTSDSDLYHYLDLSVDELVPGYVGGKLSLRQDYDLGPGHGRGSSFFSTDDAKDNEHLDLSRAYLNLRHEAVPGASLRVGRQYVEEFEFFHTDGGTLRLPLAKSLGLTAFGGQSVSYYSDKSDDWAAGGALTFAPSPRNRTRLAFLYDRDDEYKVENEAWALETWQGLREWLFAHGRFRLLEGEARDLNLDLRFEIEALRTSLLLSSLHLFHQLEEETNHNSPYVRAGLQPWDPFNRYTAQSQTALTDQLNLGLGVTVNRVRGDNDGDEQYSNEDYERYDAGFIWSPFHSWTFVLTGHYWDADLREQTWGLSGEIAFQPTRRIVWRLGTSYVDYRFGYYDEFEDRPYRQSPELHVYYTSLRYRHGDNMYFDFRLELEDATQWADDPYLGAETSWNWVF